MRKSLPLVLALSLAIPLTAEADVFDIHVGGICSTDFGSTLGHWTGETRINAPIDQTTSMATATTQMAATLDRYCTGNHLCYVHVYSNGGAVMSRTLALYSTAWNIAYVAASASCAAAPRYANHQAWFSGEYGSLNHLDMKLEMICNDGGLTTGCP
jgi:hypothetical protein